jgi:hypothetical protein
VELNKQKGKKLFQLSKSELERIENILKKAIDKEAGKLKLNDKSLTEDNPDGRKCTFKTILRLFKGNRIGLCLSSIYYFPIILLP